MTLYLSLKGLIKKNQTPTDKELSGMTLRDLWENSSNTVNKPHPHVGGGLSFNRANAGKVQVPVAKFFLHGKEIVSKQQAGHSVKRLLSLINSFYYFPIFK